MDDGILNRTQGSGMGTVLFRSLSPYNLRGSESCGRSEIVVLGSYYVIDLTLRIRLEVGIISIANAYKRPHNPLSFQRKGIQTD